MERRERAEVVSTRVEPAESRLIRALAQAEGKTVSATIHAIVVPAVRERLASLATAPRGRSG